VGKVWFLSSSSSSLSLSSSSLLTSSRVKVTVE
jgi:hypothetical protein